MLKIPTQRAKTTNKANALAHEHHLKLSGSTPCCARQTKANSSEPAGTAKFVRLLKSYRASEIMKASIDSANGMDLPCTRAPTTRLTGQRSCSLVAAAEAGNKSTGARTAARRSRDAAAPAHVHTRRANQLRILTDITVETTTRASLAGPRPSRGRERDQAKGRFPASNSLSLRTGTACLSMYRHVNKPRRAGSRAAVAFATCAERGSPTAARDLCHVPRRDSFSFVSFRRLEM